jgi:ABC-type antimicrobial peptide transport system permease subunit
MADWKREIGIRMALGARGREVLLKWLFRIPLGFSFPVRDDS